MSAWIVVVASMIYLAVLFAIAYWGDWRAEKGRSLLRKPWVYSLSIAVYCTSWTYYGSVGRAASTGIGFLPIYLGPTLMFVLGWFVIRKIIKISRDNRITSIADFISSRYGKSHLLGGLVSIIAVVGIMPYISLQLKAVSNSFTVLTNDTRAHTDISMFGDTAFYVAMLLAAFTILFGTRHIDATEQHEGMVTAIAFESVVKLLAFMAVGIFVTFGVFDGPGDIFRRAAEDSDLLQLMELSKASGNWVTLSILSMAAIIFLPRQFQVAVVENTDLKHLNQAVWMFPLYLLLINLFVLPIAFGGLMYFDKGTVDADVFVLALPLAEQSTTLALVVFIGGLSAATGMVIVATIALATMVCNDLIMPVLLRFFQAKLAGRKDLSGLLLGIRRAAIVFILFLGYLYFKLVGESYALVTIGLVSFCASAQFAPAIIGGIYWKGGTRIGAFAGLLAGFAMWGYTLVLPSFARSGWVSLDIIEYGLFNIALLKPYALFGLDGLDNISHSLFWSMAVNIGAYVTISLLDRPTVIERNQATLFVEAESHDGSSSNSHFWGASVAVIELRRLAGRFIGEGAAKLAFSSYANRRQINEADWIEADADAVRFTERLLAGAIGSASARVLVASVVKGTGASLEEMMEILDEASQVIEYSHQLESKSRALEHATAELREANDRLKELDRLKDEFLSTVAHELRTPLTSIRAFSEILYSDPKLDLVRRQEFIGIMVKESERLTRLVNQVLDLAKIESGRMVWTIEAIEMPMIIHEAVDSLSQVFAENNIELILDMNDDAPPVVGDHDKLMQVVINLLSNAYKIYRGSGGPITVKVAQVKDMVVTSVIDKGPGLPKEELELVFEKFYQAKQIGSGNPTGSGLGLAICLRIVDHLGGRIWVESDYGHGATFSFSLPLADADLLEQLKRDFEALCAPATPKPVDPTPRAVAEARPRDKS